MTQLRNPTSDVSQLATPVAKGAQQAQQLAASLEQLVLSIDTAHRQDFLDFVARGILTPSFQQCLETDTRAQIAVDEALRLQAESFGEIVSVLRNSSYGGQNKFIPRSAADPDAGMVAGLVKRFTGWVAALQSQEPSARRQVYSGIHDQLREVNISESPRDVRTVVSDAKEWVASKT